MVETPYGSANGDDVRKIRLQLQAQQEYIQQLQQRIAAQSNKIEALEAQIQQLHAIIAQKDAEIEQYSQRLQEQRYYADEEKKVYGDKVHSLQKELNAKEKEIIQLKRLLTNLQSKEQTQPTPTEDSTINQYLEKLISYYKKPTSEQFVKSLQNLIKYCTSEGTLPHRVLGVLIKSKTPLTIEEIAQQLNESAANVQRAINQLLRSENVKKLGQGYICMSSDLIDVAPDQVDWSSASAEEIFKNLSSLIFTGADKDELIEAFTAARDRLMEIGALSPLTRHAMSQQIDKMKRYPIDINEIQTLIEKWKSEIKK